MTAKQQFRTDFRLPYPFSSELLDLLKVTPFHVKHLQKKTHTKADVSSIRRTIKKGWLFIHNPVGKKRDRSETGFFYPMIVSDCIRSGLAIFFFVLNDTPPTFFVFV